MLTLDKDRQFIVYPSWANLPYAWDRLPEILRDPKKSGFLQAPVLRQYPVPPPRIDYLNGPAGGGIIVVHQTRRSQPADPDNAALELPANQWLGTLVLASEANLRSPMAAPRVSEDPFRSLVTYLEPYEYPAEVGLGLRPRTKLYLCAATPEHAASAGASIFWLATLERRNAGRPLLRRLLAGRYRSDFALRNSPKCRNDFGPKRPTGLVVLRHSMICGMKSLAMAARQAFTLPC